MNENYPSASQVIRNVADIRTSFELLLSDGKFRVVRFASPGFQGSEVWVVNEKGFLWEPADSEEAAVEYLLGKEARDYNAETKA